MQLEARLPSFLNELRQAKFFDEAAKSTLRALHDAAGEGLEASRFARGARILRGMVHLRSADGYRSIELMNFADADEEAVASYVPSATVWRWLAKHGCAVSVDVKLGRVHLHRTSAPGLVEDEGGIFAGFDSRESEQRLMSREVTHLHAAPLRGHRETIEGMISLEANCLSAVGQEFAFQASSHALQILVDVAAPYLLTLPLRPASTVETDELLPVVGAAMMEIVRMAKIFAGQEEILLISGPTGAGKSRLAKWCHNQSPRRDRPFETVVLNAVAEEIQMADLFGTKKGAYSDAVDREGAIARAEAGTLFIDEIDKLSFGAQASLLQVLDARTYRRFGDDKGNRKANVRFMIGTNVDLFQAVKDGRFREDLYYRINVLPIRLPALGARSDEVPLWARYMAERVHREKGASGAARLTASAERLLSEQGWPGNLRQLDNVLRRAYVFALTGADGAPGDVVIGESHVARSLEIEQDVKRTSLLEAMRNAGSAFVAEAERLAGRGATLDIGHAGAFCGFVLDAAVQKLGSRSAAYALFGKTAQVKSGNHYKVFREEKKKLEALCNALNEPASAFAGMLEGKET